MPGGYGDRDAQRSDAAVPGRRSDHRGRRSRPHVSLHHQWRDQDRRRHGARLPGGRAVEGHGIRAIPPDRVAQHRHAAHGSLPRRGRRAAQQAWPALKTMELGPRDRISQAFWHEQRKGNAVSTQWGDAMLLDVRHLGEKKINERLPLVRDMSVSYMGVDPVTEPVPVRPVVHYMMGGIHTDIKAATMLPGLYAAGECACVSINGANRLGSNSLTELLVFGRRAALSALEFVEKNSARRASA